jgi:hypothetical protein
VLRDDISDELNRKFDCRKEQAKLQCLLPAFLPGCESVVRELCGRELSSLHS